MRKLKKSDKRKKQEKKDFIKEYKKHLECEICGETHPACLEFHHTEQKSFNISSAVRSSSNLDEIKDEIKKCKVLCSNCHKKMHYDENHSILLDK